MKGEKTMELGAMIDCSRNAVTTVEALTRFLDLLSTMGYTFVGLYTEDTFEVPYEPYFGYQRGRFTAEEIREADCYAHSLGMELRPYIQTLAHLNQITGYAVYRDIIDTDDILLAGEERTKELVGRMLDAVCSAYQTKKVNIGMDEAHMVGLGKYLDRHGYRDRVSILMEHLEMVMELCRERGLEPQMWSDMFFRLLSHGDYYGESGEAEDSELEKIAVPEGLTLVDWDYYSLDPARYEAMLEKHFRMTDRIAFAGGAWRWRSLAPVNSFSIRTTDAALSACRRKDVSSFVMTLWGDDGAECSPFALLPSLFLAGRRMREADAGAGRTREEVMEAPLWSAEESADFRALTGYSLEEFMLLDLANCGNGDGLHTENAAKVFLYNDPLLGSFDSVVPEGIGTWYAESAARLSSVLEHGPRAFDGLFATQEKLCLVLEKKADIGKRLRAAYQGKDLALLEKLAGEEVPELIRRLDSFYAAFRRQWYGEAKPFGFEVQTIRIGGLKPRLADLQDILCTYLRGERAVIEELEAKSLPCGYLDPESERKGSTDYNRYNHMASTSKISW